MQILTKRLARESLCACGFPALKGSVPPGKEFRIPSYNCIGVEGTWECRGCGKVVTLELIMVFQDDRTVGFLPKDLFDWDEVMENAS